MYIYFFPVLFYPSSFFEPAGIRCDQPDPLPERGTRIGSANFFKPRLYFTRINILEGAVWASRHRHVPASFENWILPFFNWGIRITRNCDHPLSSTPRATNYLRRLSLDVFKSSLLPPPAYRLVSILGDYFISGPSIQFRERKNYTKLSNPYLFPISPGTRST